MDQTPQPPMPPTEEPTSPASPQVPQASEAPTPSTGMTPTTPSSNKGLIIGLVIGGIILVLVIAGIILAVIFGSKDNKNTIQDDTKNQDSAKTEQSEDALRSANAKTAKYMFDLNAVCDNGSITNAADFTKPYKLVAFAKNSTSPSYTIVTLAYGADYAAKYTDHESVNVVACLNEKPGTAIKSKTCDFKSGNEKITLDYYALKYSLTLREAKTGKLVKTLEDINAPATSCPIVAAYSKSDPKYYAKPDKDAVDAAIQKFVAE
ncbi:MAG TPA: hypothetical protein VGE13_02945 [Candidatus Saccharimonadales bacterium]